MNLDATFTCSRAPRLSINYLESPLLSLLDSSSLTTSFVFTSIKHLEDIVATLQQHLAGIL